MDQHVDLKLVKSVILAVSFCGIFYTAIWLLVSLLQGYFDIFAIALVTSLAIRPLKEWIQYYFIIGYTTDNQVPYLGYCLLFNLPKLFEPKVGLIAAPFISFIILKSSLSFFMFLFMSVLVTDLMLKLALGYLIRISAKFNLCNQNQYLDTLLTILLILLLIIVIGVFQVFAFGSVFLELSQKGQVLFEFFKDFVDDDPWESFKQSHYSKILDENLGQLWRNYTTVPSETAAQYDEYILKGMSFPIIGKVISNTDYYLRDVGVEFRELLHLINTIPKKPELLWKTLNFCLRMVFGNIGGVAYTISNFTERVIIYFTLVYILVRNEAKLVEKVLELVPMSSKLRIEISADINKTVSGIAISFILASSIHYVVTLMTFIVLELEFKYLFSALAAVVGFFPYVGAWVITLPMVFYLIYCGSFKAIVLLVVEYFVINYLDGQVYTSQLGYFDQSLIGIVIVLGIYKFGFFGIFYGPLILALGYLIFKIGNSLNS